MAIFQRMIFTALLFIPLVISMVICLSLPSFAATFTVNTTNDTADTVPGDGACADAAGDCSVRAAISEANALGGDDVINIPGGFFRQTLVAADEDANAGGDWDITSNITINGTPPPDPNNPVLTVLQASNSPTGATERVLQVVGASPVVTLNNLFIRFGRKTGVDSEATRGGGISNSGTLTINNSAVVDNTAVSGGGIYNEAAITLNSVSVNDNKCLSAGGICNGGGMNNSLPANVTVTIKNRYNINNSSTATGTNSFGIAGGIGINGGAGFTLNIDKTIISGNQTSGTSGGFGAGIRVVAAFPSNFTISNSAVQFNNGSVGASQSGGGIYAVTTGSGTLSVFVNRSRIDNNSCNAAGCGIFAQSIGGQLSVTMDKSTVSNNHGGTIGGGLTATNQGGTASSEIGVGILNSTFSGNSVSVSGGAFYIERAAAGVQLNLGPITIANNSASVSGGGVFRTGAATGGTAQFAAAVIAGNTAPSGPDALGTFTDSFYSHFGSLSGFTITGGNINTSTGDAQLGPLQNNGGPTLTHMPAATSPVLNAMQFDFFGCGQASSLSFDQRGFVRPAVGQNACDKGSVERTANDDPPYDIGGTVTDSSARPIRNAFVTITGPGLPQPLTTQTGTLGNFNFANLQPGAYDVTVSAKRYRFNLEPVQHVELTTDIALVFAADPPAVSRSPISPVRPVRPVRSVEDGSVMIDTVDTPAALPVSRRAKP